jgi:hypothetical protein
MKKHHLIACMLALVALAGFMTGCETADDSEYRSTRYERTERSTSSGLSK